MKAFFTVKRVNGVLLAKMYTDCPWPWYAAQAPVASRKEAWVAFQMFVDDLRQMIG